MKFSALIGVGASAVLVLAGAGPAAAGPFASNSPNLSEPFPVNCAGAPLTLVDAPANDDHAQFTPAFVTASHRIVVPYMFDSTQEVVSLTDGAVFEGTVYNNGDVIFSGSESTGIGTARKGGTTCTFGGTDTATIPDDNGVPALVQFTYSGTAMVMLPNSR